MTNTDPDPDPEPEVDLPPLLAQWQERALRGQDGRELQASDFSSPEGKEAFTRLDFSVYANPSLHVQVDRARRALSERLGIVTRQLSAAEKDARGFRLFQRAATRERAAQTLAEASDKVTRLAKDIALLEQADQAEVQRVHKLGQDLPIPTRLDVMSQ